jgi:hypothetical protein
MLTTSRWIGWEELIAQTREIINAYKNLVG